MAHKRLCDALRSALGFLRKICRCFAVRNVRYCTPRRLLTDRIKMQVAVLHLQINLHQICRKNRSAEKTDLPKKQVCQKTVGGENAVFRHYGCRETEK